MNPAHLEATSAKLREAGYRIEFSGETLTVHGNGGPKSVQITTEPYPGFPTDMQAQMCALLARSQGLSVVTETIFPQRYMHVSELKRMGADIQLDGPTAIIKGVGRMSGAPVMASDLRASAALVLAGLHAEGTTEVNVPKISSVCVTFAYPFCRARRSRLSTTQRSSTSTLWQFRQMMW